MAALASASLAKRQSYMTPAILRNSMQNDSFVTQNLASNLPVASQQEALI
jgi:hypothetical protein